MAYQIGIDLLRPGVFGRRIRRRVYGGGTVLAVKSLDGRIVVSFGQKITCWSVTGQGRRRTEGRMWEHRIHAQSEPPCLDSLS